MPTIDADEAEVADALDALIAAVVARGAVINPNATVQARAGDLRVWCPMHVSEGDRLMIHPRACMAPVDSVSWSDDDGVIIVEPLPGCPPDILELLTVHARLFSVTGKMRWFRTEHPRGALTQDDPLTRQVNAARPRFRVDPRVEGLLNTRTFNWDGVSHLLGVIDLLNHHRRGARLQTDSEEMSITVSRPAGSEECHVTYGGFRVGPLDRALGYGFFDRSATVTQSAPLVLRTHGRGVCIGRSYGPPKHRADPPDLVWHGRAIELSHLTFNAHHPEFTVQTLTMALSSMDFTDPGGVAREVLTSAAMENLTRLAAIQAAAEDHPNRLIGVLMAQAAAAEQDIVRTVAEAVDS